MNVQEYLRVFRGYPSTSVQAVVTIVAALGAAVTWRVGIPAQGLSAPPYRDGDRVVAVWQRQELGNQVVGISGPDLAEFRDATPAVFASLGAFALPRVWLHDRSGMIKVAACFIEVGAFRDLGMKTVLGRDVRPDDVPLKHGAALPPVWLGREFWLTRYRGDASVVGSTIRISDGASGRDAIEATIVGVLPAAAGIPLPFVKDGTDVWYLLPSDLEHRRRDAGVFFGLGRLRARVTIAEAEAALGGVAARLGERYRFDKGKHTVVRNAMR